LHDLRLRPRPKGCYETETKNYETEAEIETSMINSVACESKTDWYDLLSVTIFEIINDE